VAITYEEAGVDLRAAERFTERVRALAKPTLHEQVLPDTGHAGNEGFASLVSLPPGFVDPVLVASCDGVGTKLALCLEAGRPALIGHDLVAMCVNDVITTGARPLFLLDYLATDKIEGSALLAIVEGIAAACREAGCALTGGETAEMPGLLRAGNAEVAGFCVGVVERQRVLGPARVRWGDVIVGLRTTGLHANGFSLVRRILADGGWDLGARPAGVRWPEDKTLVDVLLTPTPLYTKAAAVLAARAFGLGEEGGVHALSHVTGGGVVRNLERLLPRGLSAIVDEAPLRAASEEGIIKFLADQGPVTFAELRRTFPVGVGFLAAMAPAVVDETMAALRAVGEAPFVLGEVVATPETPAGSARIAPRVLFR
jgi:phosphoribosylformylglycinamidine cyclo-ligase